MQFRVEAHQVGFSYMNTQNYHHLFNFCLKLNCAIVYECVVLLKRHTICFAVLILFLKRYFKISHF